MDLVTVNNLLDAEMTRWVATVIFISAVTFDFILSHDKLPKNSIREIMLNEMQRSRWVFTGAWVPYALGVLLGHFYHLPGTTSFLNLHWSMSFPLIFSMGLGIAYASQKTSLGFPKSTYVFLVAVFGMIVGSVMWPVLIQ